MYASLMHVYTYIHKYISVYACIYTTCLYLHKAVCLFIKCTQRMMKQTKLTLTSSIFTFKQVHREISKYVSILSAYIG